MEVNEYSEDFDVYDLKPAFFALLKAMKIKCYQVVDDHGQVIGYRYIRNGKRLEEEEKEEQ